MPTDLQLFSNMLLQQLESEGLPEMKAPDFYVQYSNGPILSPFKNLITVLASTTSCGNEFHNLIMDVI